jgi:uncharacterized membrane protein
MWFYKVETLEAITNKLPETSQSSKKVYSIKPINAIIALAFIVIMLILAIYSYQIGWSSGADKILTAGLGLISGIPIGAFLGESTSIRE